MALWLTKLPQRGMRMLQFGPRVIQTASLTSRRTRGEPLRLLRPFPYDSKQFNLLQSFLDPTIVKVSQENAKIIAVDGPIGVGKSAFCKILAEEFDMLYLPQASLDPYYILPSGYDLRNIDDEIPESVRSYDHKNFCVDPWNSKAGRFQIKMLYMKCHQYMDAMCHILNTGQGVVVERCYHADYVFIEAMYRSKFISKAVYEAYHEIYKNISIIFPHPHVVIYLDISVPVVQERIRTRNYSYEQNSPALTTEYLKNLESTWKQNYLKKANKTSDVLIYDWTDGGDVEVILDDLEKLDLNIMRPDMKFSDWWLTRRELYKLRKRVTNSRHDLDTFFLFPTFRVEELFVPIEDLRERDRVLEKIPECKYEKGYNYLMGDSIFNILFKINTEDQRSHRHYLSARSNYS